MKRYEVLKILAASTAEDTIVVGNVGPISREWSALRPSDANLLQVNLGLCSAVGLGLARAISPRLVFSDVTLGSPPPPSYAPLSRTMCTMLGGA